MTASERFITADEVAEYLGVSKRRAYDIMKNLNDELKSKGKITLKGKISRRYFIDSVEPYSGTGETIDE